MKNRLIALLLTFVMVASLAAGCGDSKTPASTTPEQTTPAVTTPEATTPPPETTEPPVVTQPDFFTENGQGELPQVLELPQYLQPTDTPYLYACDLGLPQKHDSSVEVHGDRLYFYAWSGETYCSMYSLSTGEFICKINMASYGVWGPLENGGFWAADISCLRVVLWDAQGNETEVLNRTGQVLPERLPTSAAVSTDGKYLLAIYDTGDLLELYDLTTGQMCVPQVPEELTSGYLQASGKGFLVVHYEKGCYFVDPQTLTVEYMGPTEAAGAYVGDLMSFYFKNALVLGNGQEGSPRFYMPYTQQETFCDNDFGCAITQIYDEQTLRFYDLRNEKYLGDVKLSPNCYQFYGQFLSDGAVLIIAYTGDGIYSYIYDLPALAAQTQGTQVKTLCMTRSEIGEETRRIADEIMEETGVELLYGSQGNDFVMFDYVGVAELDPFTVYYSVSQTAEILRKYPEGMLRETYEPHQKGLKIYLCADIYGIASSSLNTAGGVTTDIDGYIVIALDVGSNLPYDLPHELSHAFDRRISYVDSTQGTNWMQVWLNATPMYDSYSYTYSDYYGNTSYTVWEHGYGEAVWFIDTYSRTFPTEDRARIMEHLFHTDEPSSAEYFTYDNILYKARLYSYILRQCFPSCDIPEVLFWETQLGDIETWNIAETWNTVEPVG